MDNAWVIVAALPLYLPQVIGTLLPLTSSLCFVAGVGSTGLLGTRCCRGSRSCWG
jgi:hypothetical protein